MRFATCAENRLGAEFSIINPVAEADLLVSVCELKTTA